MKLSLYFVWYQGNTEKFGNYLIDFYSLLEILLPAKWGLCVQQISEMNKKVLWKYANISGSVVVALVRISHFKMSDFSRKMYGYGVFSSEKNFVLSIYSWHNITCTIIQYREYQKRLKDSDLVTTLWEHTGQV